MYIANLTLEYEIYAVGQTEKECRANIIAGFKQYLKSYRMTLMEWLDEINEDYADYHNDLWTFLREYYGVHMFNVDKGYALGWE